MQKRLLLISLFLTSIACFLHGDSKPTAIRVYGGENISEVSQIQSIPLPGILENYFGTNGSLSLNAQLSGGQARVVQVLADGTFLVALTQSSVDCRIAKYSSVGTLETSNFGSSGIADLGSSTAVVHTMIIDAQNRCLVAGGDDTTSGTAGWLKRVSADGTTITSFSTSSDWQFIGALAQQTSGKIIAVGSNNSYGQIARYNLDGSLDTTFGAAVTGKIIFNNSQVPTLSSTNGLYNVVVDASNNIYVVFLNASTMNIAKLNSAGVLVSGFGTSGVQTVSYLNSATPSQIRIAMDVNNNIIIAAQISSNIKVTAVASSTGGDASPTFTNFATSDGNNYDLQSCITTSDNNILLVGSNETTIKSRVTCLSGVGALNTTFNNSGYHEFSVGSPTTSSLLFGASIAPNGLLYVAGYQINSGVTVPYVSCLYNEPYVTQIAQSPATQEQGNQDFSFGVDNLYPGAVTPFYGSYGISLQQKARSIIELASGNLLVAMDGLTNSSNSPTMILTRLNSLGYFDVTFGTSGWLQLTNVYTNEYVTTVVEDTSNSDSLYLAGWSDSSGGHAFLRSYNATGVEQWAAHEDGSNYQGLGIVVQTSIRILLCTADSATTGHISGYTLSGTLDTTLFNPSGAIPGRISSTDFGLHMGPLYGGVVDSSGNIFVAYKDSSSGDIKVVGFQENGNAVVSGFGTAGVVSSIFSSVPTQAQNVRLGFDASSNLIVAAVDSTGTKLQIARLHESTGALDTGFNGSGIMTINSVGAALIVEKIMGLSDGSMMVTLSDDGANGSMILVRVTSTGSLDTTFNSQGTVPGIVSVQVGHRSSSYYARVASSAIVQASTGNIMVAGYEQQRSFDATPIVMRIFGAPGTTEISNSLLPPYPSGTNDTTFGSTGINEVVIFALTGAAAQNQVAQAVALQDTDTFFVALDGQSTANTENRIFINSYDSDGSLDTDFNLTGKAEVTHTYQNEYVRDMTVFSVDGVYKAILAGYATSSILGTGSLLMQYNLTYPYELDTTFGGWYGAPGGVAFGDGQQLFSVSRQSMGRIIATGIGLDGNDVILGYTPAGKLDKTFACGGYYSQGLDPIYTHVVDSLNNIVIAYNDGSNNVAVARVLADGSGLDQTFGASGLVTSKISGISGNSNMRIAIDGNGKIVVAAVTNSGVDITIKRYTTAGALDVTLTLTSAMLGGNTAVTLSKLLVDTDDKVIVVGYDAATQNEILVARVLASLASLDAGFNATPGTPGYLKYLAGSGTTQVATDALISPEGKIIVVGSKN